MKYYSTNKKSGPVALKQAVLQGLASDGGLFMPEKIPKLKRDFIENLHNMTFQEIAFEISKAFFSEDLPEKELKKIVENALTFDAPIQPLEKDIFVLELFHGPTLAFKDFAAQFMSRLMAYLAKGAKKNLTILVATSGDTGSAVAQGFYRVHGINVVILYPSGKVSEIQEKQLTTLGENITALEMKGSFDDCQKLVKQAFMDGELQKNVWLSSANSINIARLIPQTFYYFYAYAQLPDKSKPVVFSVPSGNFGNLTAGLIAKRMGLPIKKFIAATNKNSVVPEYLLTGKFTPRKSKSTMSNAMDIGNPSNFARMLDLYGHDAEKMREDVFGVSFSDRQTQAAIKDVIKRCRYTLDPHGAVGYLGLKYFLNASKEKYTGIFVETAHPAKFLEGVAMPPRLRECLNKTKKSQILQNSFSDFKEFLLSNF